MLLLALSLSTAVLRGVLCLQFPYPTVLPGNCGESVNLCFDIFLV